MTSLDARIEDVIGGLDADVGVARRAVVAGLGWHAALDSLSYHEAATGLVVALAAHIARRVAVTDVAADSVEDLARRAMDAGRRAHQDAGAALRSAAQPDPDGRTNPLLSETRWASDEMIGPVAMAAAEDAIDRIVAGG